MHFGSGLICQIWIYEIQIYQIKIQICQIKIFPLNILFVSITSSRRLENMSSRRLQDVLKTSSSVTIFRKTKNCYAEDVKKTSSRPTNVCWEATAFVKVLLYLFIWYLNMIFCDQQLLNVRSVNANSGRTLTCNKQLIV